MNTPIETKLKLLVDTLSELVDATLYRQIIGSLMYLTNTRPDICFDVNTLSRYLVEHRRVHLVAAKQVMRCLKGTLEYGLYYTGDHDFKLYGYTDSDWAGSVSDRKSTSRCCFSLGSAMTSWQSRKQSSIALNTAKEEYIATCSTSCKAMNTPMETNLKLLVDTSSELVDATLYRQSISSLMYLELIYALL